MFYDKYCELCKKAGKSPSGAALEMGISKSSVSTWKNLGRTPKNEQLKMVASYFGVSVDYLLGNEKKPSEDSFEEPIDEDARELLNERRVLASKSKKATVEQLKQMNKIIDALIGSDDDD